MSEPDGDIQRVPRARFFMSGPSQMDFVVIIVSRNKNALNISEVGRHLYKKYEKKIYIFFITKIKIKICASTLEIANEIATDVFLNTNFSTYIPSEICEVKGVAPIPNYYNEEEIYTDGKPKNLFKFGTFATYTVGWQRLNGLRVKMAINLYPPIQFYYASPAISFHRMSLWMVFTTQ